MADAEDDDIIEVAEPTSLMIPAGDGAIAIPCLDSLAEALGEYPLAFQTDGSGGLWFLGKSFIWCKIGKPPGESNLKRVQ